MGIFHISLIIVKTVTVFLLATFTATAVLTESEVNGTDVSLTTNGQGNRLT